MTISTKHKFVSSKSDSGDASLVQPSSWNDEHDISLAAGKVLGRDTSGAGLAQELPIAVDSTGKVGIGTMSPAVKLAISATDAVLIPVGTTGERPTGATGYLRYNTTSTSFEGHNGTEWGSIGGGAVNGIFWENDQTVTVDYTITAGKNAGTFGPISVDSGVTVTVPSGSTWSIV
jgi:hypothetical protein